MSKTAVAIVKGNQELGELYDNLTEAGKQYEQAMKFIDIQIKNLKAKSKESYDSTVGLAWKDIHGWTKDNCLDGFDVEKEWLGFESGVLFKELNSNPPEDFMDELPSGSLVLGGGSIPKGELGEVIQGIHDLISKSSKKNKEDNPKE